MEGPRNELEPVLAEGPRRVTEETHGIDLALGDFGPSYPGGLLIVQDGMNAPAAQNFKFVAWSDIVSALALDLTPVPHSTGP